MHENRSAIDLGEEAVSKLIEVFRLLDRWARKADGELTTLDRPDPTDQGTPSTPPDPPQGRYRR